MCSRGDEEQRARSRGAAVPSINMVSFFVSCLHPSSSSIRMYYRFDSVLNLVQDIQDSVAALRILYVQFRGITSR